MSAVKAIRFSDEVIGRLEALRERGYNPQEIIRKGTLEYLEELEGYLMAFDRLNDPEEEFVSHEEAKKILGVK